VQEYKEGLSCENIAMQNNMKENNVQNILRLKMGKDYKIYFNRKTRIYVKKVERNESIVKDYSEDLTFDEIGEKYGITHERVRQIIVETMGDKYVNNHKKSFRLIIDLQRKEFIEFAKKLGRVPRMTEYKEKNIGSYDYYYDFQKAAINSGYQYIRQERKKTISDEQMISTLKKLALKLGRTPSKNDLSHFQPGLGANYILRFGSLILAQKLAGLEPNKRGHNKHSYRRVPKIVTKQQCIDDFKKIYAQLGHKPTVYDVQFYGIYGISTYTKYLGGFDKVWKKIIKGKL
jgi:hypothetical protein